MRIDLNKSKTKLNKISQHIDKVINVYRSLKWKDYVYESYKTFIQNDLRNEQDFTRQSVNTFSQIEGNASQVEESNSVKSKVQDLYNQASSIEI